MYLTIEEKNKHPQVRLIPDNLWAKIFKNQISELIISWMDMPYEKLETELTSDMPAHEKAKVWIAIACSHREWGHQMLLALSLKLGLTLLDHLALSESLSRQESPIVPVTQDEELQELQFMSPLILNQDENRLNPNNNVRNNSNDLGSASHGEVNINSKNLEIHKVAGQKKMRGFLRSYRSL